ncbi:MAG: imelysin family protein [Aurantimonas endophytica]|uniref:Putative iron-regulated protein n=1 Tax=Aurantimonas endophytica TaxID=1522175 RepID=A0A7W6MRB8_9HYPH|nr:imelysin family protein [Aurantimonas endophytica]MBB4004950.1 putative iron-regulated protein [Aurantimonas endophytica]MCO6405757.1 peptidase [Aurantimonas endophytica]
MNIIAMNSARLACALASALLIVGAAPTAAQETDTAAVVATYADIALAGYEDALATAKALDAATDALIADPSEATMTAARQAWRDSRPSYQQTEAFRFGNPIVDDWEGRVNAWPLDEGMIDYVDQSYGSESDENGLYTANLIANPQLSVAGETIDATTITPALLQDELQEAGGIEANVATGYHAVEFLLWGQDLNGTEAGAGERLFTDYAKGDDCTNGNCDRRGEYLAAATDLLVTDLEEMVGNWQADGAARKALTDAPDAAISAILTGMGSLSYGELAGERMKLGLLLHDPEEEHDCFSDNTHVSHLYDAIGIRNVYTGRYERTDGTVVEGPSVSDLVAAKDEAVDAELRADLDATIEAMRLMAAAAEGGEAYDQQIGEGNAEGNARVQAAIDGLVKQTRTIERAVAALDLGSVTIEGSDSLDNVDAVFQ